MFIDSGKISQINRLLTTYTLTFDSIPKEKYFDQVIKSMIRLLKPYKRSSAFKQLTDALQSKKDMSSDTVQNIVIRLREIFPDEIKQLDISKYKKLIEQNESRWKEKIEPIHLDKLFYGLKKKEKKESPLN